MGSYRQFCYHITDSVKRAALVCGTVTAQSMEEAAYIAAKRANLHIVREQEDESGFEHIYWGTKGGKRRNVYVLHDPE